MWVLGLKPASFGRAASALNWPRPLYGPRLSFLKQGLIYSRLELVVFLRMTLDLSSSCLSRCMALWACMVLGLENPGSVRARQTRPNELHP